MVDICGKCNLFFKLFPFFFKKALKYLQCCYCLKNKNPNSCKKPERFSRILNNFLLFVVLMSNQLPTVTFLKVTSYNFTLSLIFVQSCQVILQSYILLCAVMSKYALETISSYYNDMILRFLFYSRRKQKNKNLTLSWVCLLPELLVSQISVPRLLDESVSSGCSMLMLPCFLAKRGGILDVIVLFFTGT